MRNLLKKNKLLTSLAEINPIKSKDNQIISKNIKKILNLKKIPPFMKKRKKEIKDSDSKIKL